MYTVNQGPSKLVAKTRSGLSQNFEKIESFRKTKSTNGSTDTEHCDVNELDISVAKPVFQQYRRTNSNRSNSYKAVRIACFDDTDTRPTPTPQYEELIRFIRDSWNVLSTENGENSSDQSNHVHTDIADDPNNNNSQLIYRKKVIVYHNDPPSPELHDFGPFDLESWWGRRLFNNITKSL